MKKSCRYCGRIHDENETCPKKPKTNYRSDNTVEARFHHSGQWINKSKEIKERDNYLCRVCLSKNILNYKQLEVHHIVPLKIDFSLRLENDNLITLCKNHHIEAERGIIKVEELKSLITPPIL